jgi:hypothetical protein
VHLSDSPPPPHLLLRARYFWDGCEPAVLRSVERALELLRQVLLRVRVEIDHGGPGECEIVGESQPVLLMVDPKLSPPAPAGSCQSQLRVPVRAHSSPEGAESAALGWFVLPSAEQAGASVIDVELPCVGVVDRQCIIPVELLAAVRAGGGREGGSPSSFGWVLTGISLGNVFTCHDNEARNETGFVLTGIFPMAGWSRALRADTRGRGLDHRGTHSHGAGAARVNLENTWGGCLAAQLAVCTRHSRRRVDCDCLCLLSCGSSRDGCGDSVEPESHPLPARCAHHRRHRHHHPTVLIVQRSSSSNGRHHRHRHRPTHTGHAARALHSGAGGPSPSRSGRG